MRNLMLVFALAVAASAIAQDRAAIRIGTMFETSGNIASLGNQG